MNDVLSLIHGVWDCKYHMCLIHHQGIICGVACLRDAAGVRSSLRRMVQYASLVAPRRLASNAFLTIRNLPILSLPVSLFLTQMARRLSFLRPGI